MKFPKGFYWGGAVTAHQSEGAYEAGGKSPAVCDLIPLEGPSGFKKDDNFSHSNFKDGIDSYHRYDEDFALLEELGFTSYRFSIDWSRVCPDGIHFSEESMQFYDDFINSMIAHGMDPMCSLYHFEMPQVLYEQYNGFYSREVVDMFVTYAYKMIDRYGDRVKKWVSFNEQNAIGESDSSKIPYGAVCPEGVSQEAFINQLVHNTFVAHAKVVKKVHTIKDALALGMVIYFPNYAYSCNPDDQLAAFNANENMNMYFEMFAQGTYSTYALSQMKKNNTLPIMEDGDLELFKNNPCDWLTLSYYFSLTEKANEGQVNNPYVELSPWGWPIDPIGLRLGLRDIYAKYHLPIMVTENGIGMVDDFNGGNINDDARINYMSKHIEAIKAAIEEGVDCRGYLMWGPIDILSSHAEMDKRYGVIYVNRDNNDLKDMKRYKKKSFYWYQKVISSNGEDIKNR